MQGQVTRKMNSGTCPDVACNSLLIYEKHAVEVECYFCGQRNKVSSIKYVREEYIDQPKPYTHNVYRTLGSLTGKRHRRDKETVCIYFSSSFSSFVEIS